jgi:hypothetical protein
MPIRPAESIPKLPAGTVLPLSATDWSYGRGQRPGQPMTLVVSRVRLELADCYGGEWAWVVGHAPDCDGNHPPCREALVKVSVLNGLSPAVAAL